MCLFSSCIDCEKRLRDFIKPINGAIKIDTLYDGDRACIVMNLKTMEKLKIKDYNSFPKKPMVGDSIVKLEGETTYTLYKKDSFYVMGLDCSIKEVVIFSSGSIKDLNK